MKHDTLAKLWDAYRAKVIPLGAPDVQIKESRLAFMSGAQACWSLALAAMGDAENEPSDEESEAGLQKISDELDEFASEVHARATNLGAVN